MLNQPELKAANGKWNHSFFFGLCLGQKLYGLTDYLSKILEKTSMPAIIGHRLASLTTETLEKMRSDRDFDLFYKLISKKASAISGIVKPELPRKQSKPNFYLFQFFGACREASNSAYHPSSAHQNF